MGNPPCPTRRSTARMADDSATLATVAPPGKISGCEAPPAASPNPTEYPSWPVALRTAAARLRRTCQWPSLRQSPHSIAGVRRPFPRLQQLHTPIASSHCLPGLPAKPAFLDWLAGLRPLGTPHRPDSQLLQPPGPD